MARKLKHRSLGADQKLARFSYFLFALALAAVALVSLTAIAGPSQADDDNGFLVPRTVLAIFDSRAEPSPAATRLHRMAEMPLNHLGYKLSYWDLADGAPNVASRRGELAAVITWFGAPVADPDKLFRTLITASDTGLRLIVLGDSGDDGSPASFALAQQVYERVGLRFDGSGTEVTIDTEVEQQDSAMVGFERPLTRPFPPYEHLAVSSPDTRVHLQLADPQGSAVVVATGPGGGFAASGYEIFYDPARDRMKWLIDPFNFFWMALGQPSDPVPDTTTLNGRRIYFSHIDGDGWNNLSEIQQHRGEISARVVLDELIAPVPDLPVSVSVIAGDVDPALGANSDSAPAARTIFALPQVEVASHTYTHPFDWEYFAQDRRADEQALIDTVKRDGIAGGSRLIQLIRLLVGQPALDGAHLASAAPDSLPRAYPNGPFEIHQEVNGALDVATALAPAGKPANLYLWSGETNPFEEIIKATREAGVPNLNGGDSRYDWEWPSLIYIAPLAKQVGTELQVYAVASNEYTYTNNWRGPYYGLRFLEKTLSATETPRRLRPANLYYHMYSGQKRASLEAIKGLIEHFRGKEISPIKASRYAEIAAGFFQTQILRRGKNRWEVSDRGALQTLRFDSATDRTVDLALSFGVLGYTIANGSLYVSLDAAVPSATVVLADSASPSESLPVRLVSSRWSLSRFTRRECGFNAEVEGYGRGDLIFADMKSGNYRVELLDGSEVLLRLDEHVREDGLLRIQLDASAITPRQLRIICPPGS